MKQLCPQCRKLLDSTVSIPPAMATPPSLSSVAAWFLRALDRGALLENTELTRRGLLYGRYDRIVGALANLGSVVSDQTVGNI